MFNIDSKQLAKHQSALKKNKKKLNRVICPNKSPILPKPVLVLVVDPTGQLVPQAFTKQI